MIARSTPSAATGHQVVISVSIGKHGAVCFIMVGRFGSILTFDTAGPEDEAALVTQEQALLTALALCMGCPAQQAAVAASLQKPGFTGSIFLLTYITSILLISDGDAGGTVQFFQLINTTLLLGYPAVFGIRDDREVLALLLLRCPFISTRATCVHCDLRRSSV